MKAIQYGALAATLALVAGIGTALAQDDFDIAIVSGGKAVADVEVLLLASGGKVDLGTSGGEGVVSVPADATNLPVGAPVDVYLIECDDTVVVVLVTAEERGALEEECERRRRENPDCECRRIGGFLWGDDVTIDIGARTVIQGPSTGGPTTDGHAFADIQLGVIADYSSYYNWEDVGCDQAGIASCSGDTGVPGVGVYLDYRLGDTPFGLNFEAHYAKLELDQAFQPDDDLPIGNTAEVNSWQFQSALVYSHGFSSRIAWFGRLGYAVLHNDGEFTSTYSTGPQSESRSNTASQLLVGTGMHFPVGENWCVRAGVDLTTSFDSGNGDENLRASFGVGYRLNRE